MSAHPCHPQLGRVSGGRRCARYCFSSGCDSRPPSPFFSRARSEKRAHLGTHSPGSRCARASRGSGPGSFRNGKSPKHRPPRSRHRKRRPGQGCSRRLRAGGRKPGQSALESWARTPPPEEGPGWGHPEVGGPDVGSQANSLPRAPPLILDKGPGLRRHLWCEKGEKAAGVGARPPNLGAPPSDLPRSSPFCTLVPFQQ